MTSFSATDAALEGFRISRRRPRALVACGLFIFAVSLLGILIEVFMPAEARHALDAVQSQQPMEAGPFLEAMAILSPLTLFGLLVQCMMATAIYRILLEGERSWLGYFRLGADELRLMALTLIYVVLFAFMVAGGTLFAIIVAAVATSFGQTAMVLFGTVAWIFALAVMAFTLVRMSLAPVITFDRKRLALLDSWPITRGHFWQLTGAYVLAIACIVVVAIVALLVFLPVAGIVVWLSGGDLGDALSIFRPPEEPSLKVLLEPLRLVYVLVSSFFTALWFAVIAAPGAYAYKHFVDTGIVERPQA